MTTPNPHLRDDEFDVELFAHRLNNVARKAWNKLTYPVRLLFLRPLLLLLLVLLGLGAGFVAKQVLTPVYQSSFVIRPNNVGDLVAVTLMNELDETSKNHDHAALSEILGIDERMAKAIRRIDAEIIWKSKARDSIKLIQIKLRSTSQNDFDTLQAKIMNYLEGNAHYALIRTLHEEEIAERNTQVKADLNEIDSIKRLMALNMLPRSAGGFVYGEAPDPVKVYEAAFKLYKEKSSLNWQKAYTSNFEVIKPCIRASAAAFPDLYWLLAIGAGTGVALCLLMNLVIRRKTA